jgi:hypothetical protein
VVHAHEVLAEVVTALEGVSPSVLFAMGAWVSTFSYVQLLVARPGIASGEALLALLTWEGLVAVFLRVIF